ncbi:MAG: hypothetical protein GQ558_02185 [Thermoplasmata archaeon]|nr:hypothetical protein [Thermoplasmata archaeon]
MVLAIILATVLLAVPAALADNGGGPPQSDISVTEVRIDVEEPMQDDEVNVTATILSNMTVPRNVTVVFLVDKMEIGNVTNITLQPGVPEEATTVWVTTAGTHVVTAIVKVGGVTLPDSAASTEVYVEAKPVGDVATLLYGLLAIALVVLGMAIVPSILFRLTGW